LTRATLPDTLGGNAAMGNGRFNFLRALRLAGRQKVESHARWLRLWPLPVAGVLVWLKLWLVSAQPILAFGGAGHDDRLFVNLANCLAKGEWLGNYNELTLAKGCFYPVWIALMAKMKLPLPASQHLLYLIGVLTVVAAVRPLCGRPSRLLLLGAVLWLNPATYTMQVLRVVRETIYPALTLLVIAGTVGTALRLQAGRWRGLVPWLLLATVALGAFWQTREEGVWILPVFAVVVAFALLAQWRSRAPRWWLRGLACAFPLLAIPCSDAIVAWKNRAAYGIPVSVEFRAHDFLAAYGALTRVRSKPVGLRVPVSKEARARIYAVSPAFATLRKHLEGKVGAGWALSTRGQCPDVPEGEIGGGWFMWAFRDATARAGYYASGTKAMQFYRQLASEIDAACEKHQLDCRSARASMLPPWQPGYGKALLATFLKAIPAIVGFDGVRAGPQPSGGNRKTQILFEKMTNGRVAPLSSLSDLRVQGWVVGRSGIPSLAAVAADGLRMEPIPWLPSPDVGEAFRASGMDYPHVDNARLDLVVPRGTSIEIKHDGLTKSVALEKRGRSAAGPELHYNLETVTPTDQVSAPSERMAARVRTLIRITKAYQLTMPIFAFVALVAFSVQCLRMVRRREIRWSCAIAAGLLGIIVTRLALLSMIDISSFQAIEPLYLSSAYPAVILFVYLAIEEGWRSWGEWRAARAAAATATAPRS
jgi:hypothetical protein